MHMRVCVTADGPTLDSEVGEDIGHSSFLLVVDTETMEYEAIENEAATWEMGAGIKAAEIIRGLGVQAVITGGVGPHGYERLSEAGIMVAADEEGSVREAIRTFIRRHGL